MIRLRQEFRAIHAALIYFTRLRMPALANATDADWRRAATYFPVAGWLVGGFSALVWWTSSRFLPADVSAGLAIVASILMTGAMHEDGFADVCDGFGGGYTKEKILSIMQDSRIGAYAGVGLIMILGLRWRMLTGLPDGLTPWVLIAAHSCSRALALVVMSFWDYAKTEGKARSVSSRLPISRLLMAMALGASPLVLLPVHVWIAAVLLIPIPFIAGSWFYKKICGYTGDCLGAVQLVCEVAFMTAILARA